MILPIVIYGDPVLRVKCKPITEVTEEIRKLSQDMIETMHNARGVGLAAPQVGIALQLAVIEVPPDDESVTYVRINGEDTPLAEAMPLIFLNPKLDHGKEKAMGEEGCLSMPDLRSEVRRSAGVKVEYQTLDGETRTIEADGLLARALQHEIDHLNGILFIDRLSAAAKLGVRRKLKRLMLEWEEDGLIPSKR
ncbi:peptide deformylase [Verrucomicrobium sp. BvORR106]|uniref:peptide deformylase n=1 Tax=Verrucomicrobium sp. BvORR106 TaxID=1403819 RepID=UPI000570316C|nr:peptide deformylase [Verrucomicrobium sp. BvORR106]